MESGIRNNFNALITENTTLDKNQVITISILVVPNHQSVGTEILLKLRPKYRLFVGHIAITSKLVSNVDDDE